MSAYGSIEKWRGGAYAGYLNDAVAGGGPAPPPIVLSTDSLEASAVAGSITEPLNQRCYVRGVKTADVITEYISVFLLSPLGGVFTVSFDTACEPSSTAFQTSKVPMNDALNMSPHNIEILPSGVLSISGTMSAGESNVTFTRIVVA